jgi:hypothetical protein
MDMDMICINGKKACTWAISDWMPNSSKNYENSDKRGMWGYALRHLLHWRIWKNFLK